MSDTDQTERSSVVDQLEFKERTDIPHKTRVAVFLTIIGYIFFINVDQGIIPPALLVMSKELDITKKDIAILSSTTFLVCGAVSIFMAPIMAKFEARSVLIVFSLFNCLGSFMFIATSEYWLLLLGRAIFGAA